MKTRSDAWELLNKYTKNQNLIKHGLAVEVAMRLYARKFQGDEDVWGIVGLLHDFDYEKYPTLEEHPYKGQEILEAEGFSEEIRRGIMAHAPHTETPRETMMHKAIFAVDELSGFIVAVTLIRPTKKIADVDIQSVLKKMKQKGFARGVSREDIMQGAQELGISLEEHIANVLEALQGVAGELGL
ncbi:MAG: HAD family hydrolase [Candidatus Andersenbacteria bacterium RIFCSPHIGHO2_12_FULL_45_11b]|uniref:HAD family hydrolase n=1 Tax=Candidatus Andersenbacteria bacterium RIFCSPHIGHO2_12_FULL_45_11b TaxID=1797282 RepID=A0A1G1X6N9_9BACT|nr:MAG: HAD family hydrolase [Candidatus Andersenbacteria bacterium RIFCSPHIGHO2_12_FULL_45_11b]